MEKIREWVIHNYLVNPELGVNYIDWHGENGECGLTIMVDGKAVDIIIRERESLKLVKGIKYEE